MSKWMPIDTAPKDGTVILAALSEPVSSSNHIWPFEENRRVTLVRWTGEIAVPPTWRALDCMDEFSYGDENSFFYPESQVVKPTHWMPLPEPPEQE